MFYNTSSSITGCLYVARCQWHSPKVVYFEFTEKLLLIDRFGRVKRYPLVTSTYEKLILFFKKEHHSLLHFRKKQFKLSNPHLEIRTDWIQEITKVLNAFMFLQKCPLFAGKWNQKELSFYISHVLDTKYSHSLKYSKVK